jgi:hypothetical protein
MARAAASNPLKALHLAALSVVAKKLEGVRSLLKVGPKQEVDVTLRIHGTIDVSPESNYTSTKKPEAESVLAVAIGALGPSNANKVREAIATTFQPFSQDGTMPPIDEAHVAEAAAMLSAASYQESKPRRGSVAGTLSAEVV